MNLYRRAIYLLVLIALSKSDVRANQIDFANRADMPLTLWIWSSDTHAWVDHLSFTPSERRTYTFDSEGAFYLVARAQRRDSRFMILGWYDFDALKRRSDFDAVNIDPKWIKEEVTESYTIRKPVWESRTRLREIYFWTLIDGCWRRVSTIVSEEYKVRKMVPEQRTRTMTVNRLSFAAGAWSKNEPLQSKLTVKTPVEGRFVRYQLTAREEELPLDNPTNTTQRLPVGDYFIWTVQDNVPTSPRHDWYHVWEEEKEITIP